MTKEEDKIRRETQIEECVKHLVEEFAELKTDVKLIYASQEAYHKSLDEKLIPVLSAIKTKNNRIFMIFTILLASVLAAIFGYKYLNGKDMAEHKDFALRVKVNHVADWIGLRDTTGLGQLYAKLVREPANEVRGEPKSMSLLKESTEYNPICFDLKYKAIFIYSLKHIYVKDDK